jgi:hypothetical protein
VREQRHDAAVRRAPAQRQCPQATSSVGTIAVGDDQIEGCGRIVACRNFDTPVAKSIDALASRTIITDMLVVSRNWRE